MNAKFKALLRNRKVGYQLACLFSGMGISVSWNSVTPGYPSVIIFLLGLASMLALVFTLASSRDFIGLRILFLGASITSVIFAFHTFFFSLMVYGLIQISDVALVGLFRSILLTSLFSLLERLTRFLEDARAPNQHN